MIVHAGIPKIAVLRNILNVRSWLPEFLRAVRPRPRKAARHQQANFLLVGQSNIAEWFNAADGAALDEFRRQYLLHCPEVKQVSFFNAATGGSALLKQAAQLNAEEFTDDPELCQRVKDNYWFDEATGELGPALASAERSIQKWRAKGISFDAVIWSQGEADAIHLTDEVATTYCNALPNVLQRLIWRSGAGAVYIQELGRINPPVTASIDGINCVRKAQREQAKHDPRIEIVSTTFDLPLRDPVHLTETAYQDAAKRMAIGIATGEFSPTVERGYVDSDGMIHLHIVLAPGQSLRTFCAVEAFRLFGDGQEQAISAIQVDSNGDVRITPESRSAAYQVDYAIGDLASLDPAALLMAEGKVHTVPVRPFSLIVEQS